MLHFSLSHPLPSSCNAMPCKQDRRSLFWTARTEGQENSAKRTDLCYKCIGVDVPQTARVSFLYCLSPPHNVWGCFIFYVQALVGSDDVGLRRLQCHPDSPSMCQRWLAARKSASPSMPRLASAGIDVPRVPVFLIGVWTHLTLTHDTCVVASPTEIPRPKTKARTRLDGSHGCLRRDETNTRRVPHAEAATGCGAEATSPLTRLDICRRQGCPCHG
jgi:hypothetical protein